jgi:acetyl-CoA synthetase
MTEALYLVPAEWAERAQIDANRYAELYRESVEDPETFWRREAQRIDWINRFHPNKPASTR